MAEKKKSTSREKAITSEQWRKFNPPAADKCLRFPSFTELKSLIVYLTFCIATLLLLDRAPVPNEYLLNMLGQAPPLQWLNTALAVYISSEFILLLCRKRSVDTDQYAWKQILFLACFYIFYWFADALQQHFILLVCIGILLQLGEAFIRANAKVSVEERC